MRAPALVLVFTIAATAAPKPVVVPAAVDLKNVKDPVDGKRLSVLVTQTTTWHGLIIRFGTAANATAFQKTPDKFLKNLGLRWNAASKELLLLDNATCPVTGKKAQTIGVWGKLGVGVHSKEAARKIGKNPAAVFKKLGYEFLPALVDLRNETCPVTGDQVYAEAPIWVDIQGIRTRVCCDRCVDEMTQDPAPYFKRLAVDPKKLRVKHGLR